jgi:hypothetical protein
MPKTYQYTVLDSLGYIFYLTTYSEKSLKEQAVDFSPVGDFQIWEECYEDDQLPTTVQYTSFDSVLNVWNDLKKPESNPRTPSKVKVYYTDGLDEEMDRREFRSRFDCTQIPEGVMKKESELYERYGVIKVEFLKQRTRAKKEYLTVRGPTKITYKGVEYKNKKVLQESLGISAHMLRKLLAETYLEERSDSDTN